MRQVDRFRFAPYDAPYEQWPKNTELMFDGALSGRKFPGYVIEAQYAHTNGFLLVTSWDCPFEESLSFLSLSPDLDVMSELSVGAAYTSVWIERHESVDANTVIFQCNNDLEILAMVESASTLRLKRRHRSRENNVTNNDNTSHTKGN